MLNFRMWFKYGLKAQKLLAQGVWGLLVKLEFFTKNQCSGASSEGLPGFILR